MPCLFVRAVRGLALLLSLQQTAKLQRWLPHLTDARINHPVLVSKLAAWRMHPLKEVLQQQPGALTMPALRLISTDERRQRHEQPWRTWQHDRQHASQPGLEQMSKTESGGFAEAQLGMSGAAACTCRVAAGQYSTRTGAPCLLRLQVFLCSASAPAVARSARHVSQLRQNGSCSDGPGSGSAVQPVLACQGQVETPTSRLFSRLEPESGGIQLCHIKAHQHVS